MPMHGLLLVLGVALVALGFATLALPVVPGAAVMYFGILLIAWADDFSRIGTIALVGLAVLAVVGTIVDNIAGVWGARFGGASGWGVLGAALGALAGLPFGIPGLLLGAPLGAAAFEFVKNPELKRAARAGAGSLAGFLLGIIAKYVFGILFVAVAAFVYFF
jgi:uncharacterized protein YqgC (DUF456 family)